MQNIRVLLTALGGPEVLKVTSDDVRDPVANEVRVRVLACGVAFADVLMRYGLYSPVPPLPFSPGFDIVGEVESCGPVTSAPAGSNETQYRPGDLIAALGGTGGYSQYMILPAAELLRLPPALPGHTLDPAEVVSVVLNYTTAYQLIHRVAKLKRGDSVLIHGAAGGVGTAALQLGALAGLKMFGTASKGKLQLVSSLGGIPIDYRSEDFVQRAAGVDAVFDPIGGRNWLRSYRTLGKGGRFVGYGMSAAIAGGKRNMLLAAGSFAWLTMMRALPGKSAEWYSMTTEKKKHPEWFREDLALLLAMLRDQSIKPVIAKRLPLREAARAHELLEHASVTGKIVLMCQD